MIDDYKYTSTPLSPKNDGPFGLFGNPSVGTNGFSRSINDSQQLQSSAMFRSGQTVNNYYSVGTELPARPDTGTHVLGSIDGSVQWIATTNC